MKLGDHFTLKEMCKSGTAMRHGIDNTPNTVQIAALKCLVKHCLDPIRKHYGIGYSPSSAFRCDRLNTILGSNSRSSHPKGEAADIEVPTIDNMELAKWCSENLEFDQLILEYYEEGDPSSGWVHISFREGNNRGQILSKDHHPNNRGWRTGLHASRV